MAQRRETYLTPAGLKKYKGELDDLRNSRRQDVAERIQRAKEIGGTVDNAEYDEAKNEQAFVEGHILELEAIINNAVIIDSRKKSPKGLVVIGSVVKVAREGTKNQDYTIVGSAEADPSTGKISNESPIGQALLGRKIGDKVEVSTPSGVVKLGIVEIA